MSDPTNPDTCDASERLVLHEILRRAKRNQRGPMPEFVPSPGWRHVLDLEPEQTSEEVLRRYLEDQGIDLTPEDR